MMCPRFQQEHPTVGPHRIRVELPFEQEVNPFIERMFEHRTFFTRLHHFVLASHAVVVAPRRHWHGAGATMIWRLLQIRHLERWRGRDENMASGQQAVYHRSRRNRAASLGAFSEDMEAAAAFASAPPPNQYFSGMNLNG